MNCDAIKLEDERIYCTAVVNDDAVGYMLTIIVLLRTNMFSAHSSSASLVLLWIKNSA